MECMPVFHTLLLRLREVVAFFPPTPGHWQICCNAVTLGTRQCSTGSSKVSAYTRSCHECKRPFAIPSGLSGLSRWEACLMTCLRLSTGQSFAARMAYVVCDSFIVNRISATSAELVFGS